MKFILATYGSMGDIYPFVWMANILKKNSHKVVIISNPYFEKFITDNDIDFIGVGKSEDYVNALGIETKNSLSKGKEVLNILFVKPLIDSYNKILEIKSPDTILISPFSVYLAPLLEKKCSMKNINVILSPRNMKMFEKIKNLKSFLSVTSNKIFWKIFYDTCFKNDMDKISTKLGINLSNNNITNSFSGTNLCLFPKWSIGFDINKKFNFNLIGFPEYKTNTSLSLEVEKYLETNKEPIIFTPGSPYKNSKNFFIEALTALKYLKKPGIFLSKFNDSIPQNLPTNVAYFDYIPLDLLLKKSCLIVHHGGIGTTISAMKSGIPQIIFYHAGMDQKQNANIVEKFGACRKNTYNNLSSNLIIKYSRELFLEDNRKKSIALSKKINSDVSEKLFIEFISNIIATNLNK